MVLSTLSQGGSTECHVFLCAQDYFCDLDKVSLATSYFDLKEYDRAAHVVKDAKNPLPYFLHMYSEFLAEETRRLDNASDSVGLYYC